MTQNKQNRLFYPPPVTPAELAQAKHYVVYVNCRFGIPPGDRSIMWKHCLPLGDRYLERRWRNSRPHGPQSKPWLYTKPVVDKAGAKLHLRAIYEILDKYGVSQDLRREYLACQYKAVAMSIHRGIAELEAQGYLGGSVERH